MLLPVAVSNQTVKVDEANYRAGPCADRRGGRPASSRPSTPAARPPYSSPAIQHEGSVTTLTGEASGGWTLDVWGQARRGIELNEATPGGSEGGRSRQRDARGASGAGARLRHSERGGFA